MFTDEPFVAGQEEALEKIASVAGVEFAEKVAGIGSAFKSAFGGKTTALAKVKPKSYRTSGATQPVGNAANRKAAKKQANSFTQKVKDFHSDAFRDVKSGVSGKDYFRGANGAEQVAGGRMSPREMSFGSRMKRLGRGTAKLTPAAAAVGGGGYAGKLGYDEYNKNK